MALWGNNDNLGNAGTVTFDYTTLIVTGTGTTFGVTGGGIILRHRSVMLSTLVTEMLLMAESLPILVLLLSLVLQAQVN